MYVIYEGGCARCKLNVTIGLEGSEGNYKQGINFPAGDDIYCPKCANTFNVFTRRVEMEDWKDEIIDLLKNNKPVGAIKVYRTHTKSSLRDAKDAVQAMPEYSAYAKRTHAS